MKPELKLKVDSKTGEPVKRIMESAKELRERGCVAIKAYDNKKVEIERD